MGERLTRWQLPGSLPALILDLDALDANCHEIARQANGKSIRIATKSIRSASVLNRILQADPAFNGLMCFTAKEAIYLIQKGFDNILLGYPSWDEQSERQIARYNQEGKKVIMMIDSPDQARRLNDIAERAEGKFYVCIDADMSTRFGPLHFGVRRSPLDSPDKVLYTARSIRSNPRIELIGIMGYEAQIAGVCDNAPSQYLRNKAIRLLKRRSIKMIEERRSAILEKLEKDGFDMSIVNGGGTGSLATTASESGVTEVTVGSGFYSPLLFDQFVNFKYRPAIFFALPVLRRPARGIYTCLGGGYVASGPAGKDKLPKPVEPPGASLLSHEAAGEVQTPVHIPNTDMEIGDPILFRPAKAGEICERFDTIHCMSGNQVVASFPTYRGEGGCFL